MTAYNAGYRVTVLGRVHRSVFAFDVIDQIPVYRVSPEYSMYRAFRLNHSEARVQTHADALAARRHLRRLHERGRRDPSRDWPFSIIRRIGRGIRRRMEDVRLALRETSVSTRLDLRYWLARLPIRGIWRRAWPEIADLELVFCEAIVDLEPDILYIHDRHGLPAAVTAKRILANRGYHMMWIYDAHEWLPGIDFQGPKVHGIAWVAAEAATIGDADSVITVSDEMAIKLRQRHTLKDLPSVVLNAPISTDLPPVDQNRSSVRENCGLDQDTDLLVYVGLISPQRGLETVLHSLRTIPDVHLALIAPAAPKRREELIGLAMELGVGERLHILDYVPQQSVSAYISSATVGLSPLISIPNHQESLGTKIREYLHAGLPIVGSDVKTMARFLEESRVGTTFRAEDPQDCARAIKQVLANRNDYVKAITPELLTEHSWERQEIVLGEVWDQLIGERKPTPHSSRQRPSLVIGPTVDKARSRRLLAAVTSRTGGTGQIIERSDFTRSARLSERIEDYRRLVAESDGLILESLQPLFGKLLGDSSAQLHHLRDVRPLAVMLDSFAAVDLDELLERIPDCWLLGLGKSARSRIATQARRSRRHIAQAEVPVLATSPFPTKDLSNVAWLPTVVDILPREEKAHGPLRVLVAPGPRGGQDALVPELLSKLASSRISVEMPSATDEAISMIRYADVFVDSFGHGTYTDMGAQAMGHGCVVLSRLDPEVASLLPASCPVVHTTPNEAAFVVKQLSANRDRLAELAQKSLAYARDVHDGRRSAELVVRTLL
jgi:glycosyltransferase involved in cell wall biosynthesis